jgi:integrase
LPIIVADCVLPDYYLIAGECQQSAGDERMAGKTGNKPTAINKTTVDEQKPRDRDAFIWDSSVPGFGLKTTPSGRKTYIFQYRIAVPGEAEKTTPRRVTIGKHGPLTPDQARKRAKELAALVTQGIDPRQQELDKKADAERQRAERIEQERRATDLEFGRIADLWLADYETTPKPNGGKRSPSSVRLARTVVEVHLRPALAGKPLPAIGRDDLETIIDDVPAANGAMRRAVHVYASVLWGWAIHKRYAENNPLASMRKPPAPQSRDRTLKDWELLAVWNAAESLAAPFDTFMRFLVLTGQRRSEVAGMAWAELDRAAATWTISKERAKNNRPHIVPLSAPVVAELDRLALKAHGGKWPDDGPLWPASGLVLTTTGKTPISGLSKAKRALDAEIDMTRKADGADPLQPWRFHDIRRTVATGLQRLGVRFEVTEAVLNHISGSKGGVAGIYQRHEWANEKRAALDAWARHMQAVVDGTEANNVISINSAGRA